LERLQQFISELKRRRVIRALVVWGVVAFAALQIYEPVMHGLHLPEWTLSFVVVFLGLGFPVTAALAWAFDIKASGIERTQPAVEGSDGSSTPPRPRGARLALLLFGLGAAASAPGLVYFFVWPGAGRRSVEGSGASSAAHGLPSVAVLPFADMSPQHDQEYFSDGIAAEIQGALAQVDGLRVAGRTSSFSFKGKSDDLRNIGQKLNVGAVLEGSVQKAGNRVRVTAQVVNARDGFHIWGQTFDRDLTDIFLVEDEIARAVVEALKLKLLPGQGPAPLARRATRPEAYNEYLLARHLRRLGSLESNRRAVMAFERALALDPGYAPAWSGLADALFMLADLDEYSGDMGELERRSLQAADKAVALAPDLADGYSARGWLRVAVKWDWPGARSDLEHALALNPGDAISQLRLGRLDGAIGSLNEASAAASKVAELDPLDADAWLDLGSYRMYTGNFVLARQALDRALEIAPDQFDAVRGRALLSLLDGHTKEALAAFERSTQEWTRLTGVALAQYDLGHARESQEALDQLIARHANEAALQVAEVYARRGEHDRAFEWLERARAQRDTGLRGVKSDPLLAPLHGDPRFSALLRKMNLPVE